jgi:hypothetical protein
MLTPTTNSSAPSGGTLTSALTILDNFTLPDMRAAYAPYALSPIPPPPPPPPPPQNPPPHPPHRPHHHPLPRPAHHLPSRLHRQSHRPAQLGPARHPPIAQGAGVRPELFVPRVHAPAQLADGGGDSFWDDGAGLGDGYAFSEAGGCEAGVSARGGPRGRGGEWG